MAMAYISKLLLFFNAPLSFRCHFTVFSSDKFPPQPIAAALPLPHHSVLQSVGLTSKASATTKNIIDTQICQALPMGITVAWMLWGWLKSLWIDLKSLPQEEIYAGYKGSRGELTSILLNGHSIKLPSKFLSMPIDETSSEKFLWVVDSGQLSAENKYLWSV